MANLSQPPPLRKERKIPVLVLFFPATASIRIYQLNEKGLRLVRCLTGCKVEAGHG